MGTSPPRCQSSEVLASFTNNLKRNAHNPTRGNSMSPSVFPETQM